MLKIISNIIFDNNFNGIPIGNYTSQYFANIYLNELDHYVKDNLRVKYYVRYMDDFIFLLRDKNECVRVYNLVLDFISEKLHLCFNCKSRYFPSRLGCDFCGYIIFEDFILVRKRSKTKLKKKIKKWKYLQENNKLDKKEVEFSINSWFGHIKHADSYNLKSKYVDIVNEILNVK